MFYPLQVPRPGVAALVDEIYERLHALKSKGLTVLLVEQNTGYALELAANPHIKTHYLGL